MNFFTKNKLIAGVLGLMAIVSVVNTQAILNLTNNIAGGEKNSMSVFNNKQQEAQVLGYTGTCIKILPATNNHTGFIDPVSWGQDFDGVSKHMFVIGFKIKNTCSRTISIIKDSFVSVNSTFESFQVATVEDFSNIFLPSISSRYSINGPAPSNISDIYGVVSTSLNIPNNRLTGVTLTGDGEMKVTNIPANSEKQFIIFSHVYANNQGVEHHSRLSIKKIRWFLTQSYNDQNLSANEVKTYNFTNEEVEKYTTSYARFKGISSGCSEGVIIGYDSNGSPIFCGDTIPQGGCAEGTVVGYNPDGTPIFCGDENTNKPCTPGTIIGYNKDGSPIYCQ